MYVTGMITVVDKTMCLLDSMPSLTWTLARALRATFPVPRRDNQHHVAGFGGGGIDARHSCVVNNPAALEQPQNGRVTDQTDHERLGAVDPQLPLGIARLEGLPLPRRHAIVREPPPVGYHVVRRHGFCGVGKLGVGQRVSGARRTRTGMERDSQLQAR